MNSKVHRGEISIREVPLSQMMLWLLMSQEQNQPARVMDLRCVRLGFIAS